MSSRLADQLQCPGPKGWHSAHSQYSNVSRPCPNDAAVLGCSRAGRRPASDGGASRGASNLALLTCHDHLLRASPFGSVSPCRTRYLRHLPLSRSPRPPSLKISLVLLSREARLSKSSSPSIILDDPEPDLTRVARAHSAILIHTEDSLWQNGRRAARRCSMMAAALE
jgi:hypothetical protein